MNVLKPFNKKISDKEIKRVEETAAKELDEFVTDLQERYDITVTPEIIVGMSVVRGIVPITHKINVVHNQRFTK